MYNHFSKDVFPLTWTGSLSPPEQEFKANVSAMQPLSISSQKAINISHYILPSTPKGSTPALHESTLLLCWIFSQIKFELSN